MSANTSTQPLRAEQTAAASSGQPRDSMDVERDVDEDGREDQPLLGNEANERDEDGASPSTASRWKFWRSLNMQKRSSWRWPSIIAIIVLLLVVIIILALAFTVPSIAEEYTKEAMVFEPTDLSIEGLTDTGVKARVQGDFTLDGSRVKKKFVRDIGRAAAWIVKAVESKESVVEVYLPQFFDTLVGTAIVPGIVVNLRSKVITHIDFVADIEAGDVKGLKNVATAWLAGKISKLDVRGEAFVPLKSGMINLGVQALTQDLVFDS